MCTTKNRNKTPPGALTADIQIRNYIDTFDYTCESTMKGIIQVRKKEARQAFI